MTGRYLIQVPQIKMCAHGTIAKISENLTIIFKNKQMKGGFETVPEMNELLYQWLLAFYVTLR